MRVQIPLSPPSSPSVFGHLGESLEIYACARDLRLRMDPENATGAPLHRSRYIEEISGDPAAVNAREFCSRKASDDLCPHAVVIAAHSFKIARARSAQLGTPTMSPMLPRAKQVMAPKAGDLQFLPPVNLHAGAGS